MAAIRAEGLSKSFGTATALQGLDLEVAEGEVLGYLGPNGAGKPNLGLRHFFAERPWSPCWQWYACCLPRLLHITSE